MKRAPTLLWLALCPALAGSLCPDLAGAQEEPAPTPEASPEDSSEDKTPYTVAPPPTRIGQRVTVRDRFEATLRLDKQAPPVESGIAQAYEDTWLAPDRWNNQLDAQRTWRSAEDLAGRLSAEGVEGFELRWGLGRTGIYYAHKPQEVSGLLDAIIYTERPAGGVREGSLDMPEGVIPAIPVMVGQSWDVDPMALARWGRMAWGQLLIPRSSQGRLVKVDEGVSGPVLEVRWSGTMTLSAFHPDQSDADPIGRPTTVKVDVKLLQPTAWKVDGDPYVLRIKSRATVSMPAGQQSKRVDYDWSREVRRIE